MAAVHLSYDIIREIIRSFPVEDEIDTRRTLVALASMCRDHSGAALNRLWEEVRDVRQLEGLLRSLRILRRNLDRGSYIPTLTLTAENVTRDAIVRFQFYSRRVQRLLIANPFKCNRFGRGDHGARKDRSLSIMDALHILNHAIGPSYLFPKLVVLTFDEETLGSIAHRLPDLLSPSLRKLVINPYYPDPEVDLPAHARNLSVVMDSTISPFELELHFKRMKLALSHVISSSFDAPGMHSLNRASRLVFSPEVNLTQECVASLGRLTCLQHLRLDLSRNFDHIAYHDLVTEFAAMRSLSVSGAFISIAALLRSITSTNFDAITIEHDLLHVRHGNSKEDLRQCLRALARFSTSLKHFTMRLNAVGYGLEDVLSLAHNCIATLLPFSNLEEFTCHYNSLPILITLADMQSMAPHWPRLRKLRILVDSHPFDRMEGIPGAAFVDFIEEHPELEEFTFPLPGPSGRAGAVASTVTPTTTRVMEDDEALVNLEDNFVDPAQITQYLHARFPRVRVNAYEPLQNAQPYLVPWHDPDYL